MRLDSFNHLSLNKNEPRTVEAQVFNGPRVLMHVRCAGCAKLYQQHVDLPYGRPAPVDGDELMDHPEIRGMHFKCPKCETESAEIVAFKTVDARQVA